MLERQIEDHKSHVMEVEGEASKADASVKQRKHALEQAKIAMDKAKHALGLANKAGLVSAAEAAKHMMSVTTLVVDKATAKVAQEQAKKDSYDKEIKMVKDEISAKLAKLESIRKVEGAKIPGGEAIAELTDDERKDQVTELQKEQGHIEGVLLRRED